MSLNYSDYVNTLTNLAPVPSGDPGFTTDLPSIIDDAEQRLYRDLQLLNTVVVDSSSTLSTNTRSFNLPSALGTYVVVETINVITPAGTTNPDLGTRNPMTPVSRSVLDFLYPNSTASSVPGYFAMVTQGQITVGPWPDAAYTVEVLGTQRPAPLSASNVTTLLSVYFPDLLVAASMIRLEAFMKNYGATVDDPKAGVTWEQHYNALLGSAQTEEAMKKFTAEGWSSKAPSKMATPPRT